MGKVTAIDFTDGNYKAIFEKAVTRLLKQKPPLAERRAAILALTEAYIYQIGEVPDGVQLQRLANWFMVEFLIDPHPDKVTRTDYPFFSKRQLRVRHARERVDEYIERHPSSISPAKAKRVNSIHSYR